MPRPPDQDDEARQRDLADVMRIYKRCIAAPKRDKANIELANVLWRAASILAGHAYGGGNGPEVGIAKAAQRK